MKAYSNVKAFTLIELLVTVAVLAILATGAIIRFDLYLAHQRLDTESYKINSFINAARVRALKTERIHRIRFEPNQTNPQFIRVVDLTDNIVVDSFNVRDHEREGRRDIAVSSPVQDIDINPRDIGFNIASPITITIYSNRFGADVRHYRIRFAPNETRIHFEMVAAGVVTTL